MRFGRFVTLLLLGSSVAGQSAVAQTAVDPRALAACARDQSRVAPFAGIVLADRGAAPFVQAEGTIDGTAVPTRDTRYRLASVGKLFTQVAIGRLIDQHRIDPHAPIGTYLRGLPAEMAAITVDQLLHHRSGIAENHMFTPDSMGILLNAHTASDLLPLATGEPLAFAPGSRTEYSNGGYYVLGAIVEAVSGKNYADYLQQEIFAPLGMTGSSLAAGPETAPPMSRMAGPGEPPLAQAAPMTRMPTPPGNPAGDAVTTAADMVKFGRALAGSALLSDATKLRIYPRHGDQWQIGQAGGRPGGNTYFMIYPDSGWVLVILTNYDPPAGELMGEALGGVLKGGACKPLSPADRPSPMLVLRRPPSG